MEELREQKNGPKIHCLTNPVSMQDTANLLLAAGGSAIMAQDPAEAEEITSFCQATLLNIGVPDKEKLEACILAGKRANLLEHPVVLDPVGAGAGRFRRKGLEEILTRVKISVIRCNQEEASALIRIKDGIGAFGKGADDRMSLEETHARANGGVESNVIFEGEDLEMLAFKLGNAYSCTVLVSGEEDVVSDGKHIRRILGGASRMRRITGSGCMLSALCALFCGYGYPPYEAAVEASRLWKKTAQRAEELTQRIGGGIGSFHIYLFDVIEELCYGKYGKR